MIITELLETFYCFASIEMITLFIIHTTLIV